MRKSSSGFISSITLCVAITVASSSNAQSVCTDKSSMRECYEANLAQIGSALAEFRKIKTDLDQQIKANFDKLQNTDAALKTTDTALKNADTNLQRQITRMQQDITALQQLKRATYFSEPYTTMRTFHPGCNGPEPAFSGRLECGAAAQNYCKSKQFAGGIPQQASPDAFGFVCVE